MLSKLANSQNPGQEHITAQFVLELRAHVT